MSDKRERAGAASRRKKLLQLAAGAAFLAVVAVVVLIVLGSGSDGGDAENLKDAAAVNGLLDGLPQDGLVLGEPTAKVELIEYGDLQCPVCKAYSEEILPEVIDSKVRSGEARIAFRNYTIIGPQSVAAGAAALAAGAQGRGWNYVELFYRNQGTEDSGYADDEFLSAVARAVGVGNIARWNEDRKSARFTGEVTRTTERAREYGFTGTPSFAIEGPGTDGVELLGTPSSAGAFEQAIEEAG
jgi:protein-disulfide isomerase